MRDLSDIRVIKELMVAHGVGFSKSLGQNFLTDAEVCPLMAEYGGARPGAGVLEIGPGIGILTAELAHRADKVVAVELDNKLLPVLAQTLEEFENTEIVHADILRLDLHALLRERFGELPVSVCANLPYYITSPVLMLLLESRLPFETITVMVQKEAAQRLCAAVGDRLAGAVTVAVNYYARAEVLFEVPRTAFVPPPKVDSCVIRLEIRPQPPVSVADEAGFFRMVKAAFGQRRKTAANGISAGMGIDKALIAAAIESAGFGATVRAESLTMDELARLYNEIHARQP